MVYKELLLSAGGGIVDKDMLVDYSGKPTICIGLGGTGIDCLKQIKKQIYSRIKPDDISFCEPVYKHVRFLAIDSDYYSIADDKSLITIDKMTEFLDISCPNQPMLPKASILRQNPSLHWISDQILSQNANRPGTGGIRQIGRLLMMQKVSVVIQKIQDLIIRLINEFNPNSINIHVITGMGGGTGSGIFLDICYIIRHIIKQLALDGRAIISGYFFLPDVNLERVREDIVRKYIPINGFAAMKELDYCMDFQQNGGEWNQIYDGFSVKTKQSPVDVAFLVSAKDESGFIRENGYINAINVVADYILNSMIRQGLPAWLPFVPNHQKRRGACYQYCFLGVSHVCIPYKDINSYLAARIFEAYQELPVTNHDIDSFISDNGFTYRNIYREMSKNADIVPLDTLIGLVPAVITSLSSKMSEELSCVKEAVQTNRIELEHSTIKHIKNKLIEIATCQGKGTVYSSLFLRNLDHSAMDLGNVIDGHIKENIMNLSHARSDLELREQYMRISLLELQNAKLNKRKKTMNYVSAVHSYYTQLARIALYEEIDYFLKQLKYQVVGLYERFFLPINAIFVNIAETFNDNYFFLTKHIDFNGASADKIIGLSDENFKASLDAIVESIDSKMIVNRFISYMMDRSDEWLTYNSESHICTAVSNFFIQQLSGFTHKNIDDYLREKYQAVNQQQLSIQIYQDVLIRLKEKARPLFWTNTSTETFDNNLRTGFCLFPNNSATITAAAIMLNRADNQISISSTTEQDRISLFIFHRNIPMFMYRGSAVYKAFYEQHMTPGLHIYEGTDQDHRDFRKLHSIIPLSLYYDDFEEVKDFICEYKRAVENGIIIKLGYDYQLRLVDNEDFSTKKLRIKTMINKYSESSRKNLKKHIEEYKDFLKDDNNTQVSFKNYINLPNNGATGYEDSVVRDHVFASVYYTSILYEQLAKIDELESLRLQLQSICNNIDN